MKILSRLGQLTGYTSNGQIENHVFDKKVKQYKSLFEDMEDGYYEVFPDGQFVYFNRHFCRLTGFPPKTLKRKSLYDVLTESSRSEVKELFRKVCETGLSTNNVEWEVVRQDGEQRIFEASIATGDPVNGSGISIRGMVRDITDKKETEDLLTLKNRIVTKNDIGMALVDRMHNKQFVSCNRIFEHITGYNAQDIIHVDYSILFGPETDIKSVENIDNILKSGQEFRTIIKCYRKNSSIFWNELTLSPVFDQHGHSRYFIATINDLTDYFQLVSRLRNNEKYLHTLLEKGGES